ncbi:DUF692 domain-containing protein [Kordia sp.]|uniref:MNIO family bufferin maturase n=1 Tax=Kordia sp. TaxID=1965332 RepID=UPI0025C6222D|nr:DUF692 domain-containing protein [Kordia sp.]MCH2194043.1 DUF692 domain-containing protein [Kordia sp.]
MKQKVQELPDLGLGLGLRGEHFNHILEHRPAVDWFEIISENFMDSGGRPRYVLDQIAEKYPIVMHGVSMSIGSTDPLNFEYLKGLKKLADEINPKWISDHLCWTGVLSLNSHDLLPVVLNEESLQLITTKIKQVQDYLERPLILENPSTYLTFQQSTIPEWQFLKYMVEETNCGLLLDVNNVYVSSFNNEFDPIEYIEGLPFESIVQMHLAGHQHNGDHIIDTHDSPVVDPVWELFSLAWERTGGTSTLLEWDGNIPEFDVCHEELLKAKNYMDGFKKQFVRSEAIQKDEQMVSNPIDFLVSNVAKDFVE